MVEGALERLTEAAEASERWHRRFNKVGIRNTPAARRAGQEAVESSKRLWEARYAAEAAYQDAGQPFDVAAVDAAIARGYDAARPKRRTSGSRQRPNSPRT